MKTSYMTIGHRVVFAFQSYEHINGVTTSVGWSRCSEKDSYDLKYGKRLARVRMRKDPIVIGIDPTSEHFKSMLRGLGTALWQEPLPGLPVEYLAREERDEHRPKVVKITGIAPDGVIVGDQLTFTIRREK